MGAYSSLATLGLNLALQHQAQQKQEKQLNKQRDQQIKGILANDAEARRVQDLALQKHLAQQRARAGASGVGSTGGSADAVLGGLEQESNAAMSAQSADTQRRLDQAQDSFGQRKRNNLLDFSSRWLGSSSGLLGGGQTNRSLLD